MCWPTAPKDYSAAQAFKCLSKVKARIEFKLERVKATNITIATVYKVEKLLSAIKELEVDLQEDVFTKYHSVLEDHFVNKCKSVVMKLMGNIDKTEDKAREKIFSARQAASIHQYQQLSVLGGWKVEQGLDRGSLVPQNIGTQNSMPLSTQQDVSVSAQLLSNISNSFTQTPSHAFTQTPFHASTQTPSHASTQTTSNASTQTPSDVSTQTPSHASTETPTNTSTQAKNHGLIQTQFHATIQGLAHQTLSYPISPSYGLLKAMVGVALVILALIFAFKEVQLVQPILSSQALHLQSGHHANEQVTQAKLHPPSHQYHSDPYNYSYLHSVHQVQKRVQAPSDSLGQGHYQAVHFHLGPTHSMQTVRQLHFPRQVAPSPPIHRGVVLQCNHQVQLQQERCHAVLSKTVHAVVPSSPEHACHQNQLIAMNVSHNSPVHAGIQGGVKPQRLSGLVSHLSPVKATPQGGFQSQHLPRMESLLSPVHDGLQGGAQPQHMPGLMAHIPQVHAGLQGGVQPQQLPGLASHPSSVHACIKSGVQPQHLPGIVLHITPVPNLVMIIVKEVPAEPPDQEDAVITLWSDKEVLGLGIKVKVKKQVNNSQDFITYICQSVPIHIKFQLLFFPWPGVSRLF